MAIEPKTLKGFRDFLPQSMAPRMAMIRSIEAVFERHGFQPLMTPALEYAATLTGKYGDEGDKLLYQFEDHGQRKVALRYDLTVPLARVVAEHRGALPMPFRRYQIAPVWRAENPQRGRYREFMQCDADIAGGNTASADAEVLITGLSVLRELGVDDAVLLLNHRDVLAAILCAVGVTEPAAQLACIRAVDKLDKVGQAGVRHELESLAPGQVDALLAMFAGPADAEGLAQRVLGLLDEANRARFAPAFERLRAVLELVEAAGFADRVRLDPTIARGLDYYTGIIYETRLTDARVSGVGAVMSGGRYDGLIGLFGREQVPAVGISVGLDRLLAALQELGLVRMDGAAVPIYVTVFGDGQAAAAARAAQALRTGGLRVEVDAVGGKLGKQLERAHKRGARLAVVIGPDEVTSGEAVVKDLARGEQVRVALGDLPARAKAMLLVPIASVEPSAA